jgi:hypothetical protein
MCINSQLNKRTKIWLLTNDHIDANDLISPDPARACKHAALTRYLRIVPGNSVVDAPDNKAFESRVFASPQEGHRGIYNFLAHRQKSRVQFGSSRSQTMPARVWLRSHSVS